MPTSIKEMPFDMSKSKIPARDEPLSTATNAKVTPLKSFPQEASINLGSIKIFFRKLS